MLAKTKKNEKETNLKTTTCERERSRGEEQEKGPKGKKNKSPMAGDDVDQSFIQLINVENFHFRHK